MHDEGLIDFLARFKRVRMSLPNVSEGMAVAAFQNGLNRNGSRATKKLLRRLMKYPPTTWEEIHNAYCAEGHLKELLSDRGRANFAPRREQLQGTPKPPSPARTIQMIIGGGDGITINHVKFTTTHKLKRSITYERFDDLEGRIIFDKLDADGLSLPHYDALVITLRIANTNVKRIMVDDGSVACIIHP
uniref:Uncharacterized protein n=1 Tax=Nicotiana tabacum TaxID=4097 RepID=A0A1S3Z9K6_TOBAC|nr:PREDICTED: uncharacterized protein LOC107784431 [Nicotiana tabacum]